MESREAGGSRVVGGGLEECCWMVVASECVCGPLALGWRHCWEGPTRFWEGRTKMCDLGDVTLDGGSNCGKQRGWR